MKCSTRVVCSYEGCKEVAHYNYDTRKDMVAASKFRDAWTCSRHSAPDEVLSIGNPVLSKTMVAEKSKYPNLDSLFWAGSWGFTHGPGFKAWADDFPEGTKLVVTAQIVLPE